MYIHTAASEHFCPDDCLFLPEIQSYDLPCKVLEVALKDSYFISLMVWYFRIKSDFTDAEDMIATSPADPFGKVLFLFR